jgi:hypothetical protein
MPELATYSGLLGLVSSRKSKGEKNKKLYGSKFAIGPSFSDWRVILSTQERERQRTKGYSYAPPTDTFV